MQIESVMIDNILNINFIMFSILFHFKILLICLAEIRVRLIHRQIR